MLESGDSCLQTVRFRTQKMEALTFSWLIFNSFSNWYKSWRYLGSVNPFINSLIRHVEKSSAHCLSKF